MDTFTPPRALGLKGPDPHDRRDRLLYAAVPNVDALPDRTDLESLLPPAQDQRSIGSCVAWAGIHVCHAIMVKDGHLRPYLGSVPALYRWCRELDEAGDPGAVGRDGGTYIRNFWWVARNRGIPAISRWAPRYLRHDLSDPGTWEFPEESRWRAEPPPHVRKHGLTRQMVSYFRLPTLEDMLKCLADGFPFEIGFEVYRSFYDASGKPVAEVRMPVAGDRLLGGHAVTVYGYDRPSRLFLARNQWGATAHQGSPNFRMPFDVAQRIASDAWTGRVIEGFRDR